MNTTATKTHVARKARRVRVYPRLAIAVRQRLIEYSARKGVTARDAIEEAILQYLDGSSDSAKILAQLQRIALALDAANEERLRDHQELLRAVEVLADAFRSFAR